MTSIELDVDGIPLDTKTGVFDWKIQSGADEIGTVRAEIIPKIVAGDRVSVVYEDVSADALQDRQSEKGVAVVDPTAEQKAQITNTATLTFPEALRAFTGSTLQRSNAASLSYRKDTDDDLISGQKVLQRFWTAKRLDATVWNFEKLSTFPLNRSELGLEGETFIEEASSISFRVAKAAKDPLIAVLRLYDTTRRTTSADDEPNQRNDPHVRPTADILADSGDAGASAPTLRPPPAEGGPTPPKKEPKIHYSTPKLLLEMEVRLAESARVESLPMPIANAIRVFCFSKQWRDLTCTDPGDWPENKDFDVAARGEQRAIGVRAMEDGACWLALDATQLGKMSAVYGPQSLRVSVHREGADDKPALWPVDFAKTPDPKCPTSTKRTNAAQAEAADPDKRFAREFFTPTSLRWFQLEAPKGDGNADAAYVVRVEVAAESKQYAVYRTGIDGNVSAEERKVRPDQVFETRLRSRGLFGWRAPIRTYLTVPLEISGLRFPAASVDLNSTSDAAAIQLVSPRTGLLFTVEPWDYDKSSHRWPVPLRFQTGFHMFQFAQGNLAFSYLLGLSGALPLFDAKSTQAQTAASIGLFYELDLRQINSEFNPSRQGHFLVSLGFNVLSLLGSK